jgi:hypothetical protein
MAVLKDCELWFAKLDRPNGRFNKDQPTWEVQIRTTNPEQKNEWLAAGLAVKRIAPEDESTPYWRANLKKKSIGSAGEAKEPVKLVDGALNPLDPRTLGNGSVANIRLFEYNYTHPTKGAGVGHVLMAVQVTKHIVYISKPREDFEEADYERVSNEEAEDLF